MGQTSPVCNKHRALHSQTFGFSGILIELSARHGGHGTPLFVETYLHTVRVVNPFLQHLTRTGHRVSQRVPPASRIELKASGHPVLPAAFRVPHSAVFDPALPSRFTVAGEGPPPATV